MKSKRICIGIISALLPLALLAQTENWVYRYNGLGNGDDGARSTAYGFDGNIYAAGYSRGTSTDFTVIALTNMGDTNWVFRYNGPVDATDDAYSIDYGIDGNLYIAGGSYFTVGRATDFTVVSLACSGAERWVYLYDGGGSALDIAYSIACGADSNIYAAGNCWTGGGHYWDFTIISLPPSGPSANWVYKYDGPGSEMDNSDAAYSIVYGSDGNIYAVGKSYGTGTWRDFTVVSVTSSGAERWVYRYNGSANLDDVARSVTYGGDGNIYVTGFVRNSNDDIVVVSLPSSGPPANWVYLYNGLGNGNDAASSITYGLDGNVYVAGYSTGSGTYEDFTVISLTPTGSERWVYTYNGLADTTDMAASIIYGLDGNIYVAGQSTGNLGGSDFTVISLDTSGTERWVYRYNGPGSSHDDASSIVYGSDGNIYSAGKSYDSGTLYDFTVISLGAVGIEERDISLTSKFFYIPSVFTDNIPIRFSEPCQRPLKIILYNIYGGSVFEKEYPCTPSSLTLKDEKITRLSSGVYFIVISSDGEKYYNAMKCIKLL
jgi:hypothetical protein